MEATCCPQACCLTSMMMMTVVMVAMAAQPKQSQLLHSNHAASQLLVQQRLNLILALVFTPIRATVISYSMLLDKHCCLTLMMMTMAIRQRLCSPILSISNRKLRCNSSLQGASPAHQQWQMDCCLTLMMGTLLLSNTATTLIVLLLLGMTELTFVVVGVVLQHPHPGSVQIQTS